ncbi:MAG: hypothetical protein A3H71_01670 [Candidatus Sungbacteria bacterium RIFCSPLOWO2_02_FULL_48_13b]|uniref:Uncharacterized protein n=1 Tax=Candidatus Sungbacteria bacterium RIFCSPLOWO2_02_FULL_48_13b TaxID=1802283 RepID=A0A1G2LG41_9BACT|nr:MAG: hypothetical protein A3H71_01670 [Candidatus Sungbacteria bacterium RIFCSPLOWO2_02_FULL_48_13b]
MPSKNIFFAFSDFARHPQFFSIKEKKMFLLVSALNASGRRRGFASGSGAAEFPPLPPRPRGRPKFFRRQLCFK